MRFSLSFPFVLVALLLAGNAAANRPLVVGGETAAARSKALSAALSWHRDLDEALADAAREGKPLFWLHVVGDLEGST